MDQNWWEAAPLADQPEATQAPTTENWWDAAPLADAPSAASQAEGAGAAPAAMESPSPAQQPAPLDIRDDPYTASWKIIDGQEYTRHKNGTIYKVSRDEQGNLTEIAPIVNDKISRELGGKGGSKKGQNNAELYEWTQEQTTPQQMPSLAGEADPNAVAPTVAAKPDGSVPIDDRIKSAGRSFTSGAINTTGTMARGLASMGLVDDAKAVNLLGQLDNAKSWDKKTRDAFVLEVSNTMYGSPGLRLAMVDAADKLRRGEINSIQEDPELLKQFQSAIMDPRDRQAYKMGQALKTYAEENFAADPRLRTAFETELAQGAGSIVPFLLAGLIPGGQAYAAGAGVLAGRGESLDNAMQYQTQLDDLNKWRDVRDRPVFNSRMDRQQLLDAVGWGTLPGASESLPIETLLERIPKPKWAQAMGAMGRIVAQMAIEGGQEAAAQLAQNIIANFKYNPEQDITEGVLKAGGIGSLIGGGMQTTVEVGKKALERKEMPAPPPPPAPGTAPMAPPRQPQQQPPAPPAPGTAPMAPPRQPAPQPGRTPEKDSILRQAYAPEDIAAMSDAQYEQQVQDLQAQGATAQPHTPAPMAPPRQPSAKEPPPPGQAPAAPVATRDKPLDLDQVGTGLEALFGGQDQREEVRQQVQQPTPAQAEAGNYKHAHVTVNGFGIAMETPKGGTRSGTNEDGQEWSVQMPADYGRLKGTQGMDGDQIDVYVGENTQAPNVFVVNQRNLDGSPDEHKVMMGFDSEQEARDTYLQAFSDGSGQQRLDSVVPMSLDEFQDWIDNGDHTKFVGQRNAAAPVPGSEANQANVDAPAVSPEPVAEGSQPGTQGSVEAGTPVGGRGAADYVLPNAQQRKAFSEYLKSGKSIADLQQVAKETGADLRVVSSLMQEYAQSGVVVATRSGRFRRAPKSSRPDDLVTWISGKGGIQDQQGDMNAIIGGKNPFIPGKGPLVRPKGVAPDTLLEAAIEEGYLPDGASIRDLYDAIDTNLRGNRQVREGDVVAEQKAQEAAQAQELEDRFPEPWQRDMLDKHGLDATSALVAWDDETALGLGSMDERIRNRAAELVAGGMEADSAVERAAIEYADELAPNSYDDVWEIPVDEIYPETAPTGRAEVATDGGRDQGRQEEEGVQRPAADVSRTGEEGQVDAPERQEAEKPATGAEAVAENEEEIEVTYGRALDEAPGGEDLDVKKFTYLKKPFPKVGETFNIDTKLTEQSYISEEEAAARIQEWKAEADRQNKSGENTGRVIVSLFDYTGKWSRPFVDAGFTVLQYDLRWAPPGMEEDYDIIQYPPLGEIMEMRGLGMEIYGVLSACPCTTFAASGARWWEGRHDVADRAMVEKVFGPWVPEAFDSAVEYNKALAEMTKLVIQWSNPTGFHVLENPMGRISRVANLGDPALRFQPHNFGDPYTKRTQLWGDFNVDLPTANVKPTEGSLIHKKGSGDDTRSDTPEGFAWAFFAANNPAVRKPSRDIPNFWTLPEAEQEARRDYWGEPLEGTTAHIVFKTGDKIERAGATGERNAEDEQYLATEEFEQLAPIPLPADQVERALGTIESAVINSDFYERGTSDYLGKYEWGTGGDGEFVYARWGEYGKQEVGSWPNEIRIQQKFDGDGLEVAYVKRDGNKSAKPEDLRWGLGHLLVIPDFPVPYPDYIAAEKTVTTETGADGRPQAVVPGAERITDAELVKRKAEEPKRPKVPQKPADEGLFSDDKDQIDMLDVIKQQEPQKPKGPEPAPIADMGRNIFFTDDGKLSSNATQVIVEVGLPMNPDATADERKRFMVDGYFASPRAAGFTFDNDRGAGIRLVDYDGKTTFVSAREVRDGTVRIREDKNPPAMPEPTGGVDIDALFDETLDELAGDGVKVNREAVPSASWVIKNKATGEIVMETYDRAKVDALNTAKYEAVPILEHLQSLNQQRTAGQAAKSAAQNVVKGIDDVFSGLNAMFNDPNKLGSGPSFDEETYQKALPFFRSGAAHFAKAGQDVADVMRSLIKYLMDRGMNREAIQRMKPYVVRYVSDVRDGKEQIGVPGANQDLERDRGPAAASDSMGAGVVPDAGGRDGAGAGAPGTGATGGRGGSDSGRGAPSSAPPAVGKRGDLPIPDPAPEPERFNPSDSDAGRGDQSGEPRLSPDNRTPEQVAEVATDSVTTEQRLEAQRKANRANTTIELGNIDNIAATVPMLHKPQQEDVQKIEQRFAKASGMLITNGTGTGKTFSGLGVVKRFERAGKRNILIVAPSKPILKAWKRSADLFGLEITELEDTKDVGAGITMTTYANLGQNMELANRDWDLVVTDEAHNLMMNEQGEQTEALKALRAITLHPRGYMRRAEMLNPELMERMRDLKAQLDLARTAAQWEMVSDLEPRLREAYSQFEAAWKQVKRELDETPVEARTKSLFLSATPFAWQPNVDWAEGYLFDYPADTTGGGYNSTGGGYNQFMVENFGYRMRTGKLTKPEASVDTGLMEREFHERLRAEGALSGRTLETGFDYDRRFQLVENARGRQIDQALDWLREQGGGFLALHDVYNRNFDYLSRARLLEAMKAESSIPYIKAQLKAGRKVVVFWNYNEGEGFNVFPPILSSEEIEHQGRMVKGRDLYAQFLAANPYIEELNFAGTESPRRTLAEAFGEQFGEFTGKVTVKQRQANLDDFNNPQGKVQILGVQADAGGAGLSAHDTLGPENGGKQRVLINLGLPTKPVAAIQQEGRINRDGQKSNALFRYFNTGTNWERFAFASRIAERASTAENLAMGNRARTLKESFIDAFEDSGDWQPGFEGEGTGGVEIDRGAYENISEFERAKSHYFANQKKRGRRDQREGVDYFATPEPLGVKMLQWAGIKPGDRLLEPSAGHGAISRYFPETTNNTIIEPSTELLSKAALRTEGRTIQGRFEDHAIVNKYDAIIMNPPFGSGGATAIQHLEKATKHLRNGGRVVALIPTGPAADAKFDKWWQNTDNTLQMVGEFKLPSVTFNRAGTSVMTRVVIIEKHTDKDVSAPVGSYRDISGVETLEEFFDAIEFLEQPKRTEPKTIELDAPVKGDFQAGGVDWKLVSNAARLKKYVGGQLYNHLRQLAKKHNGEAAGKDMVFNNQEDRDAFLADFNANPNPNPSQDVAEAIANTDGAPEKIEFNLGKTVHSRLGTDLFVATFKDRVPTDVYSVVNNIAKTHGGYYSSYKGSSAIPGFQFRSEADRQAFLDDVAGRKEAKSRQPQPRPRNPNFGARVSDREAQRIIDAVNEILQRVGGRSLRDVQYFRRLYDDADSGAFQYVSGLIKIALEGLADPQNVARHETIHLLLRTGVISKPEWAALRRRAKEWRREYQIEERYRSSLEENWPEGSQPPGFTRDEWIEFVMDEEAVAEAFAYHWSRQQVERGRLGQIFNRLVRFFEQLRNWLTGNGYTSADQIFDAIEAGEIAQRTPRIPTGVSLPTAPVFASGRMEPARSIGMQPSIAASREGLTNTATKAFKRWFGDSKVVDKQGNPLVVYHGTFADENFDAFRPYSHFGNLKQAQGRINNRNPMEKLMGQRIIPAYLSIQNPLRVEDQKNWTDGDFIDHLQEVANLSAADVREMRQGITNALEDLPMISHDTMMSIVVPVLKRKGYDGLVYVNKHEGTVGGFRRAPSGDSYMVFDPTQIKSVYNSGAFDPNNPDFLAARDLFDTEPGADNLPQTVVPGAQALSPQELAAIKSRDAKRRAELQAQAPMRPTVEQKEQIGGLFADVDLENDPQGSLFAKLPMNIVPQAPLMQRMLQHLKSTTSKFSTLATRKLWDRFVDIKKLQEDLQKLGRAVPEWMNVYQSEELYYGKVGGRLDKLKWERFEPIMRLIRKHNLTVEEVDKFLMAMHARERNDYIASINPKMPDGGSGILTADAIAHLRAVRAAGKAKQLMKVAREVYAMNREGLAARLADGLITQKTYDELTNRWKYYVPLRGWAVDIDPDADPELPRVGSGFSVRGKEFKSALGRDDISDSPLAYSFVQAQEGVVRGEKNRVGLTFLRLMRSNPAPDLWFEVKGSIQRFKDANGQVVEKWIPETGFDRDLIHVKLGGKTVFIRVKDRNIRNAMLNMGSDNLGGVGKVMHYINRWLSSVNTQYNPEFILTNLARDLVTAGINVTDANIKGLESRMLRDVRKGFAGAFRGNRGDFSTEWAKYFREFNEAGGKISFFGLESIEDKKRQIAKEVARMQGTKNPAKLMGRGLLLAAKQVSDLNQGVENALRLSAYVNARKLGASRDQAASLARNLTVNFNKRGEWGTAMNAWYLFYNAGIQGSVRMIRALRKSRKAQAAAVAIMTQGFLLDMANRMWAGAGEDDDDEKTGRNPYDAIPFHIKERNMILFFGPGKDDYFKWPLPWGYNTFYVLGQQASQALNDPLHSAGKATTNTLNAVLNAFNPIGGSERIERLIAPTVLDPIFDIGSNRNAFDVPLMPDYGLGDKRPDSEKAWNSTPDSWKSLARELNAMSGGNEVRSGNLDFSPETLEYWTNFVGGGMLAFANRTAGVTEMLVTGRAKDIDTFNVPFVRRFYGTPNERQEQNEFYQLMDEIRVVEKEFKLFKGKNDEAKAAEVEATPAYQVHKQVKNHYNTIAKLKDNVRDVQNNAKFSEEEKDQKIEQYEKKIRFNMVQALRAYYKASGLDVE